MKIGSWLFVEGLSRLLPTLLGLLLFIFVVDYFIEMDVPQRIIISVLAIIVLGVVIFNKLCKPFLRHLSDDALVLEVEKQNADLKDSLISAVQFSRDFETQRQGVSPAMVAATIEAGTQRATDLNFGSALNEQRFRSNMLISVFSVFLLGAFLYGMLNHPTMNVFMHRLFFYDGSEYAKSTYLEFYDPDGKIVDGVMKIYRGQDCPLVVRVREDSLITDVEVKMYYRDRTSGYWVAEDMVRTKTQEVTEFRIVYKKVAVGFEAQARGGDGRTEKIQIELEDPPQFSNLAAEVIYPDYAVEVKPGDLVRVFDREEVYKYIGPHAESDDCWEKQDEEFGNGDQLVEWGLLDQEQLATARSEQPNSPESTLVQIARKLDLFTERQYAQKLQEKMNVLTVRSEFDRNQLRDTSDFLESFGGKISVLDGCSVRLRATANCELKVAELVHPQWQENKKFTRTGDGENYELMLPADELLNGKYQISLRDESMRVPPRAAGFEIDIQADESPEVRASLKGISGLVINRAKLPFTVTVSDDHRVTRVFLRYSWQDDTGEQKNEGVIELGEYEPVPSWDSDKGDDALKVSQILPARAAEFTQQFFDLDTLPKEEKIPEGSGLKLTLVAVDNDDVPSPNSGVSKEFLLRVVSEEEFRADLLRREKEARQEFDLIYKRQIETQTDTEALAADAKSDDESLQDFYSDLKKQLSGYTRSQRLIGENIEGVIGRMEDLLVEGLNNRLDESTGEFEDRYTDDIIAPMQRITDELMLALKAELDSARREIENEEDRVKFLSNASEIQKEILAEMEKILKEMEKNEGLQEIINRVFEAKKNQEKIKAQTDDERRKRIKGAGSEDADEAAKSGKSDKEE